MSDFDPKDIVQDAGSDFDAADIVSDETAMAEPKAISKTKSAVEGGRQGMTLGFADEGVGAVGAGLDSVQALLNDLGIASESPSQVNAKLKAQGFTGDIGPTDSAGMYSQMRDEDRAQSEAAMKANPGSFIGGAMAGGLATTPLMPTSILAPIAGVAKTAPLATKVLTGAGNAARMGAITGLGSSKAEDLAGMVEDTAAGMGTGMVVGGAIPVAGAALTGAKDKIASTAGKILPESVKDAYQRGKEGINIAGQEFYDTTTKRLKDVVDDVSSVVTGKSKSQQAANAKEISNLDNKLMRIEGDTKSAIARGEERAAVQTEKDVAAQQVKELGLAEKIQGRIADLRGRLGKRYEKIDKVAEKLGISPENRDVIGGLQEEIVRNSNLPESQGNALMNKIAPYLGKKDMDSYRGLKQELSKLFDNDNRVVSRAAKKAYADLRNNYINEFNQRGYTDLANRITETNKRWGAAMQLEDDFFSNVRKPDQLADRDTLSTMAKFGGKDSKQIADANKAAELLNTLDPKQAPGLIKSMTGLADEGAALKAAKNVVPELPNPEIARLQGILEQAKAKTPAKIEGLNLNSEEAALKNELSGLLPKFGMNTAQDVAENKLGQTMDFLGKEKGPEYIQKLQETLKPLNKDIQLRNLVNGVKDSSLPINKLDLASKIAGGSIKAANKAGKVVSSAEQFLQKGVKKLSDANPEQLQVLGSRLATTGPEGEQYAKVLEQAAGKNVQSRNAIIFGLMQQPGFRKLFEEANGKEEGE